MDKLNQSRIHVLANELNLLLEQEWEDFTRKLVLESLTEIDELGYRIVAVSELKDEDLLLLPQENDDTTESLRNMMRFINDHLVFNNENLIKDFLNRKTALENSLRNEYLNNAFYPLFKVIHLGTRLLVHKVPENHEACKVLENYSKFYLLDVRNTYVRSLTWFLKRYGNLQVNLPEYLLEIPEFHLDFLNVTTRLISYSLNGRVLHGGLDAMSRLYQIINTHVLQCMESRDIDSFKTFGFWDMHQQLLWEIEKNNSKFLGEEE